MGWIMPETTEWAKKQNLHEPTRSYGEEIFNLVKDYAEGKGELQALEIGAAWGVSAMAILLASPKIFLKSVDKDEFAKAPHEVKANELEDRFEFFWMDSDYFFKKNPYQFDIIYVDGSHLYENVKPDFFNAWNALKSGGLFICDDFTHPANIKVDKNGRFAEYGVSLALWELVKEKKIKSIGTTTRLFYTVKE